MKQDFIRDNPMIIQVLWENQNKKADTLMADAEEMSFLFSPAFEQKMERLIRAQRKPYYPLVRTNARKTLLALAAAFILMLALVFSVSALRAPFVKFIVETYEKFSAMVFVRPGTEATPVILEKVYMPEYIPEGYVLDEENIISFPSLRVLFFEGEHDTIEFRQFALGETTHIMNTEGVPTEKIPIGNGAIGLFHTNMGKHVLVWENSQYGFELISQAENEVLLVMVRSLKEK